MKHKEGGPYGTTSDTAMKYGLKCKFNKLDDLNDTFSMLVELNDELDMFDGFMDKLYKLDLMKYS